jgi:1,4-alpha-glucan branching enzyme
MSKDRLITYIRRCVMAMKKGQKPKKVTFQLQAPEARKVLIAGDFNDWSAEGSALKKTKDNVWRKEVNLKPGRYEYKFVVDGDWMVDPSNSNRVYNSLGSENSVLEI